MQDTIIKKRKKSMNKILLSIILVTINTDLIISQDIISADPFRLIETEIKYAEDSLYSSTLIIRPLFNNKKTNRLTLSTRSEIYLNSF